MCIRGPRRSLGINISFGKEPNEIYWENVLRITSEKNISLNELSRRLGIPRTSLLKAKRLKDEPRISSVIRMANALEVDPNALILRYS